MVLKVTDIERWKLWKHGEVSQLAGKVCLVFGSIEKKPEELIAECFWCVIQLWTYDSRRLQQLHNFSDVTLAQDEDQDS